MRHVTEREFKIAVTAIRAAANFAGGGPVQESGGDWEDYYLNRNGAKVKVASATYNEEVPCFELDENVCLRLFAL